MNGTSLCLNVGIKVNLNYPDWGATEAPTLDSSRDIDAGGFLLEILTFISLVNSIVWRGDLCRGGDSWKFRYKFKIWVFNFWSS